MSNSDDLTPQRPAGGTFAQYEDDLRRAERKVAGEIDPGARAVVVAVAVLAAMATPAP